MTTENLTDGRGLDERRLFGLVSKAKHWNEAKQATLDELNRMEEVGISLGGSRQLEKGGLLETKAAFDALEQAGMLSELEKHRWANNGGE